MAYKPIFEPVSSRPDSKDVRSTTLAAAVQLNFSFHTWLLIGATIQAIAFSISSSKLVLFISAAVLVLRLTRTLMQANNILPNPYMQGVIPGRVTALAQNDSGELEPAARKIAVLHLGAKTNSPLGLFSPRFSDAHVWLAKMSDELEQGMHGGFLGQTSFSRNDERGAIEFITISYWDSIEDLWAFAHSGTHREGWLWWEKTVKLNNAVGIHHEIYEADAKHWETVYINFQPTLQGATTFVREGKEIISGVVNPEFVNPLVDARKGKLAKSSARFGREENTKFDVNRVGKETYATERASF